MRVRTTVGLLAAGVALAGCGTLTANESSQARTDPQVAVVAPASANPGDASVMVSTDGVLGPLTPLTRRTAGSVTLRLFTTPSASTSSCAATGCLPSPCATTQQLVTELSTPAIAAVLTSSVIAPPAGSPLALLETMPATGGTSPTTAGTAEGSPVQVVTVHASDAVARVTMTTAAGSDESAPVKGLAALAVPGTSMTGQLVAYDSQGHALATLPLPEPFTAETPACQPTSAPPPPTSAPTLPSPGPQPADPAAATQAVQAAFHTAFTHVPNQAPYASLATVQDGSDLHATLDQLRQNFAQAASTATVTTEKIVFTSPTAATLEFTLNYTGGLPYGTQIGTAVLEGGSWLVSRATYCGVMAFGGATCPTG